LFRRRVIYNQKVAEVYEKARSRNLDENDIKAIEDAKYKASTGHGINLAILNMIVNSLGGTLYVMLSCPVFGSGKCNLASVGNLASVFFIVVMLSFVAFHVYVNRKCTGYPDPFGILYEIRHSYYVPVPIGLLSIVLGSIDPGGVQDRTPIVWTWGIVADFAIFSLILFTLPYQIYRSYYYGEASEDDIGRSINLSDFLENETGAKLFENHLLEEFSAENLTFWKSVKWWKEKFNQTSKDIRRREAQNIFSRWLSVGALFQVNVSHPIRDTIGKRLEEETNVSIDLFDGAQKEIYRLMDTDSFSRFKQTRAFKQYIGSDDLRSSAFEMQSPETLI